MVGVLDSSPQRRQIQSPLPTASHCTILTTWLIWAIRTFHCSLFSPSMAPSMLLDKASRRASSQERTLAPMLLSTGMWLGDWVRMGFRDWNLSCLERGVTVGRSLVVIFGNIGWSRRRRQSRTLESSSEDCTYHGRKRCCCYHGSRRRTRSHHHWCSYRLR